MGFEIDETVGIKFSAMHFLFPDHDYYVLFGGILMDLGFFLNKRLSGGENMFNYCMCCFFCR